MTKQEIMKMTDSANIMRALAQNRDIWDEELSNHLREVKRQENLERFGEADPIYTPAKQNNK